MAIVLLLLFGYAVVGVVPLLTKTPGYVENRVTKDSNQKIEYLATLEYESYAIRTQGVQIALGFIIGLSLAAFGMVLFAVGATDAFEATADRGQGRITLKSTAPGLVVLIISGAVISFAITKDIRRTFQAAYEEGNKARIDSKLNDPRSSGEGLTGKDKD